MATSRAPILGISIDPNGGPYYRQLYEQLRRAILDGRLNPGMRLPATRTMARDLGCARNTVLEAFEQLHTEGYLESRVGSGTFVSSVLPEEILTTRQAAVPDRKRSAQGRALSERGRFLAGMRPVRRSEAVPFDAVLTDVDTFPFELWTRLLSQTWRTPTPMLVARGNPLGDERLREGVASYLRAVRGLHCEAGQIMITTGVQQGLDLVARVLLDPDDPVWIEEPGYMGLRGPLLANGARLVPVPVDEEGLSVEAGRALSPDARMALVAPSHNYPLGIGMTLARRLALLDWAKATGAWIVEDDYDSEYRYDGRPLAALQGLDSPAVGGDGRVAYLGSFSKVLFPSIRLGYLVIPEDLVDAFAAARAAVDDHPSMIVQPALARFIEEGHFAAHIRRMRLIYQKRQNALLAAAERHLSGLLTLQPDSAGVHLIASMEPDLAARTTDWEIEEKAQKAGITVRALSRHYLSTPQRQGLLLGYAGWPESKIEAAVAGLAKVLRD